jgi:hypothetical protein
LGESQLVYCRSIELNELFDRSIDFEARVSGITGARHYVAAYLTITTAPLTAFSGEEVKVVLVWKKVH